MNSNNPNKYFLNGFKLVNKSLKIYYILVIIALINVFFDYFRNLTINKSIILSLISVTFFNLFAFITLAIDFSTPVFYNNVLGNKGLDNKFLFTTTKKTAKRLVVPFILFILVFFGLIIGLALLL